MKSYAYFYTMSDDANRIRELAPAHVAYWHELSPDNYQGGPFSDKSGGIITFEAENDRIADCYVINDPFYAGNVFSESKLKEWIIK
jgi:uncharacterized protein YciI